MTMIASGWRQHQSGSLRRFLCLQLQSGICLNDCTLHEQNGKRWIGLPGKPVVDSEGRHGIGDNGKRMWVPAVEIPSREVRDRFTAQAL
jgi:hypothetical protein